MSKLVRSDLNLGVLNSKWILGEEALRELQEVLGCYWEAGKDKLSAISLEAIRNRAEGKCIVGEVQFCSVLKEFQLSSIVARNIKLLNSDDILAGKSRHYLLGSHVCGLVVGSKF